MRQVYKKSILLLLDTILLVYIIVAMVSFNKPDESKKVCSEVNIEIADQNANGFLTAGEVKKIMRDNRIYPLNRKMTDIRPREIEDLLCKSPFVKTAECYKTTDNHVFVSITQRLPIIRIKSQNGEDYYLDDKGGVMPNSNYTSDLIIATGNINQWFARNYIGPMANVIMGNDLWKNMIEQINVLPDRSIEIVPRIGNHIVYLGSIPQTKYVAKRQEKIEEFVKTKLTKLEKFYKYGLSQVGWNKYPYISLEFNNQIICKKDRRYVQTSAEAAPPVQNTEPKKEESQASEEPNDVKPAEVQSGDKKKESKADGRKVAEKQSDKKKAEPQKGKAEKKKTQDEKKKSDNKDAKKKTSDKSKGNKSDKKEKGGKQKGKKQ